MNGHIHNISTAKIYLFTHLHVANTLVYLYVSTSINSSKWKVFNNYNTVDIFVHVFENVK